MLKSVLRKLAGRAGYAVISTRHHYAQDGLFTLHNHPFQSDPAFRAAYQRGVEASGGVDPAFEWRVHTALWAAFAALSVPGDFVECGVNAGFMSSAIMHYLDWAAVDKRFYLVDTFDGPVMAQFSPEELALGRGAIAEEALAAGAYLRDVEVARRNFAEWPNAVVVPGVVPEVLRSLEIDQVAFLHIDMNCAAPEVAALEFFWQRLAPGGLVLLDDYAYLGHDCQRVAIDTAARQLGVAVLSLPTGQGLILKPRV